MIVPALALVLGLPMTLAVGTSLLVIALTSAAALAPISQPEPSTSRSPLRSRSPQSPAPWPERGCTGRSLNRYCAGSSHCCSSASQHSSSQRTPAAEPRFNACSPERRQAENEPAGTGSLYTATIPSSPTKTTLHPAHIPREAAGSSRRCPAMPASQAPKAPAHGRKSPLVPAQPGTTKTGRSRRRSRVRVPSLP